MLRRRYSGHAELVKAYLRMYWGATTSMTGNELSVYGDSGDYERRAHQAVPDFSLDAFFQYSEALSESAAPFLADAKDVEMRDYILNTWEQMTHTSVDK